MEPIPLAHRCIGCGSKHCNAPCGVHWVSDDGEILRNVPCLCRECWNITDHPDEWFKLEGLWDYKPPRF